jgi:hypothetical protein
MEENKLKLSVLGRDKPPLPLNLIPDLTSTATPPLTPNTSQQRLQRVPHFGIFRKQVDDRVWVEAFSSVGGAIKGAPMKLASGVIC